MIDKSFYMLISCSFAMAVRSDGPNNRAPLFLRSYINPQDISALPDIKIWEAARATSAAPMYFKPMKVGDYELIDGGLGANNPLGW
jgi:patatin-like phospholipase/acyl hydrolase